MMVGRPLPRMPAAFNAFFSAATSHAPYDYQRRLACGERADGETDTAWLAHGSDCRSQLINIPTGLGKTAAVVMAWLWNVLRQAQNGSAAPQPNWPTRLAYCLPMRTLVEQTQDNAQIWLLRLSLAATKDNSTERKRVEELVEQHRSSRPEAERAGFDRAVRAKWKDSTGAEHVIEGSLISPLAHALDDLLWLVAHSPIILMGGEELDDTRRDWDLYPEKPAILIGTQDMLLSRALNRGYGMSRYRWPMHFGLLNNDCLWVMDETQLMGAGLATACQLEAFRRDRAARPSGETSWFGSHSATWYASATSSPSALETREWRGCTRESAFSFGFLPEELSVTSGPIAQRIRATKALTAYINKNFGKPERACDPVIGEVLCAHQSMLAALRSAPSSLPRRTLLICNTVDRARAVHAALRSKLKSSVEPKPEILLLHSRFRPADRSARMDRLKPEHLAAQPAGQIVVATQVVEAGVDMSSAVLWTEIAPLSCLIQRLGRLNRHGEFGFGGNADSGWTPQCYIIGLDLPPIPPTPKDKKEKAEAEATLAYLPYERAKCEEGGRTLEQLNGDASPAALLVIRDAIAASIVPCSYSLQRHELHDFFDTDSNLSLGYTDVSPFVRGLDEDTDVQVYWRRWEGSELGREPPFAGYPSREELCAVPIGKLTGKDAFSAWRSRGWLWLGRDRGWAPAGKAGLLPGAVLLLPVEAGGYDAESGWTGADRPAVSEIAHEEEDPDDEETLSFIKNGWRSIAAHTDEVRTELETVLSGLAGSGICTSETDPAYEALDWHDIGKNHPSWSKGAEAALQKAGIELFRYSAHRPLAKFSLADSPVLTGKSGHELRREVARLKAFFRPGVTHEVASALALRQHHLSSVTFSAPSTATVPNLPEPQPPRDLNHLLAEYLVMSHHGRVRKVLRNEIPRTAVERKSESEARGVTDGDVIESVSIRGQALGCAGLSTDCRRMGRDATGLESYTKDVLRLLAHYGPFRLAYLEALFRAADCRASKLAADSAISQSSGGQT